MNENKAIVVGAGLVGSLLATLLARKGISVDLYERRSDMRKKEGPGGRSINLAMSHRGWKALDLIGLRGEVEKWAIPMYGRKIHDENGDIVFQPYGKENQAIYSVPRGLLNEELLNAAEATGKVRTFFNHKCLGIDKDSYAVEIERPDGTKENVQASILFATDGAFSPIRTELQRQSRVNYSQEYLSHGYKEIRIPPGKNGAFQLDDDALHIWPRGDFMLIALPNPDKSFTGTLFMAYENSSPSFEQLNTKEEVLTFFEKYFPDIPPVVDNLWEEFEENPTSDLVTIRCNPWAFGAKVLMLGDASHAIVPFYGQGMNSGFEDCSLLAELMEKYGADWERILDWFNRHRIEDANAISDLAKRNFIEMRDHVGSENFLLRKKIEKWLNELYPEKFLPVYSMVTFSHISYADALKEQHAQDLLFDQIFLIDDLKENWKSERVKSVFQDWIDNKTASDKKVQRAWAD